MFSTNTKEHLQKADLKLLHSGELQVSTELSIQTAVVMNNQNALKSY